MAVSLTKPTKMPEYTPEHIISEEESVPFRQREYTPKHFISEEESIQTLQTNEQAVQIEVKPTEQPLAVRDAEVCMSDLMKAIDLTDTEIQEQFITTFYKDIKSKRKLLKKHLKFKAKGYLFDWKHLLLNSVVAVITVLGVIFLPELLLQGIWALAGDGSAEGAQVLGELINLLKPLSAFSAVTVTLAFSLWIGQKCRNGYYHT